MKTLLKLLLVSFILFENFSCKEFEADYIPELYYRISEITEIDNLNGVEKKYTFIYQKNKLVECKTCFKNDNNEFQEGSKMNFSYEENIVNVLLFRKKNDIWIKHQLFEFSIKDQLISEKLITRFSFPECNQCWKYCYKYQENHLLETSKYLKNTMDIWEVQEKTVFRYDKGNRVEYNYFMKSVDGDLILDYKREYNTKNGLCECWVGGLIIRGQGWKPTQQMEFSYLNGLMSAQSYYNRNDQNDEWHFCVSINYKYDINNNLIERLTSNGNSIVYEYEIGEGNTSIFFCSSNAVEQTNFLNLQ